MGSPSNFTVFLLALSGLFLLPFAAVMEFVRKFKERKKPTTEQKLMHNMIFETSQVQRGGLDSQDHT